MTERTRTALVWSVATGAACMMAATSGVMLAYGLPLPAVSGILSGLLLVAAVAVTEVSR